MECQPRVLTVAQVTFRLQIELFQGESLERGVDMGFCGVEGGGLLGATRVTTINN